MSGASSLAAAKRRRSKSDAVVNKNPTSTSTSSTSNSNIPALTTQDSFKFIFNRLVLCENNQQQLKQMILNNQGNSIPPSNNELISLNHKVSELQNKLDTITNNNGIFNSSESNSISLNVNEKETFVQVDQFNNVMNQIATDMTEVTNQMNEFRNLFLTIQNNYLSLKNDISKLDTCFNKKKLIPIEDDEEEEEEAQEEEEEQEEEEAGEDEEEEHEHQDEEVLNSLKKLTSSDIKEEVAKELASKNSLESKSLDEVE